MGSSEFTEFNWTEFRDSDRSQQEHFQKSKKSMSLSAIYEEVESKRFTTNFRGENAEILHEGM